MDGHPGIRREATRHLRTENLLVCDLVGSTALAASIGAERYAEFRGEHFDLLRATIEAHGGRQAQFTGDGLLATLPSSVAALACASAMHAAVARENARPGAVVAAIRVGITTGDAEDDGTTLHGLSVVEAFRICDAAETSQTLCSEVTARTAALQGIDTLRELGPRELKGIPGRRPVFEVPWTLVRAPLPATIDVQRGEGGFVGRDAELARLRELADEARSGQVRIAVLTGEPGVGKSRLAAEFAGSLHDDGSVAVLHGRADPYGGGPLELFVSALRPVLARDDLGRAAGPHAEVIDRLRNPEPGGGARPWDPSEQERLFAAIAEVLRIVAADATIVAVLDDLHVAGADAHRLLHYLALQHDLGAVLIVATFATGLDRDDQDTRSALGRLRRERTVTRLDLEGLAVDDVSAILTTGGQHPGRFLPEVVERVHRTTGGNPLYALELVRAEVAARDAGGRVDRALPESIRELIAGRLGSLAENTGRALTTAAVIGRTFDLDLLAAIDGRSVDEVDEALEPAVRAGVVREDEASPGHFQFVLPLTADVLAADVTPGRRARLHHRIAEALETRDGDDRSTVAKLAYHWGAAHVGGTAGRAVDYALAAAADAASTGAFGDAADHFRRALDLVEAEPGDDDRRYRAAKGLADALTALGDAGAARPHHRTAAAEAERLGDAGLLADVALSMGAGFNPFGNLSHDPERGEVLERAIAAEPPPETRARLLVTLAGVLRDDDPRVPDLADDASKIAAELGDHRLRAWVLSRRHALDTDPKSALDRLDNAEQIVRSGAEAAEPELELGGWAWMTVSALELGDVELLRRASLRRDTLAASANAPVHRWTAAMHDALRTAFEGRLDDAEAQVFRAISAGIRLVGEDAVRFGGTQLAMLRRLQGRTEEFIDTQLAFGRSNPEYVAATVMSVAWLVELGRLDEAADEAVRIPDLDGLRRDFDWINTMSWLAMAAPAIGDEARARHAIAELAPFVGRTCSSTDAVLWHTVAHAVAVAKRRLGDADADGWLETATHEYERFEARPWLRLLAREYAGPRATGGVGS